MLARIVTSLTIIATASVVVAIPAEHMKRGTEVSPTIDVCTGSVGPDCIQIPMVSDTCVDFTGGPTFPNKEVSYVVVPLGFFCTFSSDFGCNVGQDAGVSLTSGTWSMFSIDFNDEASSFTCSPV